MTGLHSSVTHGHRNASRYCIRHVCERVGVSVLSLTRRRCRTGLGSHTRARVNKCHSLRERDVRTPRWNATRRIYRTNRHVNVATSRSECRHKLFRVSVTHDTRKVRRNTYAGFALRPVVPMGRFLFSQNSLYRLVIEKKIRYLDSYLYFYMSMVMISS